MTGVQTCALPIFLLELISASEEVRNEAEEIIEKDGKISRAALRTLKKDSQDKLEAAIEVNEAEKERVADLQREIAEIDRTSVR